MKERFKTSSVLRILVAGSLTGTFISSCHAISLNETEGEITASVEATSIPRILLQHTQRLNDESKLSTFVVDQNNDGELALFSKRESGLWEYGELREKRGGWVIEALTTQGVIVEVPIENISAVGETPDILVVEVPTGQPEVELSPHITVPILPPLPIAP